MTEPETSGERLDFQALMAKAVSEGIERHGTTSREKWSLAMSAATVVLALAAIIYAAGILAAAVDSNTDAVHKLESTIEGSTFVRADVYNRDRAEFERRIDTLERGK